MKSAQSKSFSSEDIVSIIKACGENYVERFELGALKLTFLTKNEVSINNINENQPIEFLDSSKTNQTPDIQKAIEEIEEAYDMDAFRNEDPEAFEEDLILSRRRDSHNA